MFAGGDAVNNGPGLAVEAIADGMCAAEVIDKYLNGVEYIPFEQSYAEQNDLTAEDFSHVEESERQIPASLGKQERAKNFNENVGSFDCKSGYDGRCSLSGVRMSRFI